MSINPEEPPSIPASSSTVAPPQSDIMHLDTLGENGGDHTADTYSTSVDNQNPTLEEIDVSSFVGPGVEVSQAGETEQDVAAAAVTMEVEREVEWDHLVDPETEAEHGNPIQDTTLGIGIPSPEQGTDGRESNDQYQTVLQPEVLQEEQTDSNVIQVESDLTQDPVNDNEQHVEEQDETIEDDDEDLFGDSEDSTPVPTNPSSKADTPQLYNEDFSASIADAEIEGATEPPAVMEVQDGVLREQNVKGGVGPEESGSEPGRVSLEVQPPLMNNSGELPIEVGRATLEVAPVLEHSTVALKEVTKEPHMSAVIDDQPEDLAHLATGNAPSSTGDPEPVPSSNNTTNHPRETEVSPAPQPDVAHAPAPAPESIQSSIPNPQANLPPSSAPIQPTSSDLPPNSNPSHTRHQQYLTIQQMQANSNPLPKELQDQFTARFKVPAPQTHGQLQIFLYQQAQAKQSQNAAAAALRQKTLQQQAQQQQKQQQPVPSPGHGQGGESIPDLDAAAAAQTQSPSPASPMPQPPLSASGPAITSSISNSISSQLERIANGPSPSTLLETTSRSSVPPYTSGSPASSASGNGRPGSSPGSMSGNHASALAALAAGTQPRDINMVGGMNFGRHIPANVDVESIKRQMLALQQSQNRRMTGNPPPPPVNNGHMNSMLGQMNASNDRGNKSTSDDTNPAANSAPTPSSTTFPGEPEKLPGQGGGQAAQSEQQQAMARMREAQLAQARMAPEMPGQTAVNNHAVAPSSANEQENARPLLPTAGGDAGSPLGAPVAGMSSKPAGGMSITQASHVQFLGGLSRHLNQLGIPYPPGLFQNEPADPKRPGSLPTPIGIMDICGKKLDVMRLWYTVIHAGGGARLGATNAWAKLAEFLGLPPQLPEPYTINHPDGHQLTLERPGDVIQAIYSIYLMSFEEQWQRQKQLAQGMANAKQPADATSQQGATAPSPQQTPLMNGTSSSAPTDEARRRQSQSQPHPMQTTALPPNHPQQPAAESTSADTLQNAQQVLLERLRAEQQQVNNQMNGTPHTPDFMRESPPVVPSSAATDSSGKKKKKPSKKATKEAEDGSVPGSARSVPNEPTSVVGNTRSAPEETVSPHRPKRPRFKVEYKPLQHEIQTYGGWNLAHVNHLHNSIRSQRQVVGVDDLGVVDIEALCMCLRSRLSTEVSYALTVLDILSMPGEGEDKGGLGLAHCGELLDELVDLVEECAFGDDGWQGWREFADLSPFSSSVTRPSKITFGQILKGKWRADHSTLSDLANDMDHDISVDHLDRPPASAAWGYALTPRKRIETVHVGTNLLRNFSMMGDNFEYMTASKSFLDLVARLGDLQLVKPEVTDPSYPAAPFSLSDVLRIRKDSLDIFFNLASDIDLSSLGVDTAHRIFDLFASFLSTSDLTTPSRLITQPPTFAHQAPQASPLVEMVLDGFARMTLSDRNRRVLRQVSTPLIADLFETLVKMLPFSFTEERRLRSTPYWLEYYAKISFCIYNIAFAASLNQRVLLRNSNGVSTILPRMVEHLAMDSAVGPPTIGIICRRLCEVMGILNGSDSLANDGTEMTFGSEANGGGLKGWTGSNRAIEAGWLAHHEDTLLNIISARRPRKQDGVDVQVFSELERVIWAE